MFRCLCLVIYLVILFQTQSEAETFTPRARASALVSISPPHSAGSRSFWQYLARVSGCFLNVAA